MRDQINTWTYNIFPVLATEITPALIRSIMVTLLFTLFFVYAIAVCYWLLYPYKPIVIESLIVKNADKKVYAGTHLKYKIIYNKKMDITGVLSRKLINNVKIDLADSMADAPVGADTDCVYVKIPRYADPGIYYLWWSATYKVNPIRSVTVSKKSDTFTVLERPQKEGKRGEQGEQGKTGATGKTGNFTLFGVTSGGSK